MKSFVAVAVSLVLLMSPAFAQSHRKRVPAAHGRGAEVTVGSSVRITDIGEVIGPTDAIISVTKDLPEHYQSRTDGKQSVPVK